MVDLASSLCNSGSNSPFSPFLSIIYYKIKFYTALNYIFFFWKIIRLIEFCLHSSPYCLLLDLYFGFWYWNGWEWALSNFWLLKEITELASELSRETQQSWHFFFSFFWHNKMETQTGSGRSDAGKQAYECAHPHARGANPYVLIL